MKAIKCIVSVILGIVMAFWSACTSDKRPASAPSAATQEAPATQPTPPPETQPANEKDLPIRRPIME